MLRRSLRALVALVVVGAAISAEQAQAGWHHHHRYAGYGYGSSGGSYGSSGGSWGSWGSSGGWAYGGGSSGGWRGWGSSGGSWGSSGGWSYGSCGSSGGSWGSSGGYGSSGGSSGGSRVISPAAPAPGAMPPATPPAPSDASPAPGPAPTNSTYHPTYGPARDAALISVKVPADAQVFVNNRPTSSTGTDREYISRDLQSGARYNYDVRIVYMRDGEELSAIKSVQLTAGQSTNIDFLEDKAPAQTVSTDAARTTLIVKVPADARLYLAGRETKATGEVREFTTSRLPSGSEWNTYAIRAVVERDGQQQVREEKISLKAGESREVTLSFDGPATSDKVAETASR
jgi:uncharacterized protein (TIGR03000 family)